MVQAKSDDYTNEYKKTLITLITRLVPSCIIYLFGSRARRTHSSGADIDIALDAGHTLDRTTLFSLFDAIEESNLPIFVDVIDLHDPFLSEEMKREIKDDGILWKK